MKPFTVSCATLLCLVTAGPALAATLTTSPSPAKAGVLGSPALLRDNPLLQGKVTVEATDRPLGDVLSELSRTLKVDLTASSRVADQRVTLHVADQPLYQLMDRLPGLLSHLPENPHGYYWENKSRPAGERPEFNLWRDLRSVTDEEYERDYPRREAAVMLRNMRDLSRMTAKERKNYRGDYPYVPLPDDIKEQPFGADSMPTVIALRQLSDDQLNALMNGEKISLDPAPFTDEMAAANKKTRDYMKHLRELSKLVNTADPYPNGIPEISDIPPAISVYPDDRDGQVPSRSFLYGIHIDGFPAYESIDPYDTAKNPDPNRLMRSRYAAKPGASPSPIIDLTPFLKNKSVTDTERGSVGFTLQALAKAAHINMYQEAFLKPNPNLGFRSNGIATLKAPLSDLILEICDEWNYQALKVGDDYYFWSRTWVLDRNVDIPDRLISKWLKRYAKQGTVTLDDHAEIAAAITWPQMAVTLAMAMPEGTCSGLRQYHMFRVLGRLTPSERAAAFSTEGLPLADMTYSEQQAFAADYQKELAKVSSDELDHAILKFQTEKDGPPTISEPIERIIMLISSDGTKLFGSMDYIKQSKRTLAATPSAPSTISPVSAAKQ